MEWSRDGGCVWAVTDQVKGCGGLRTMRISDLAWNDFAFPVLRVGIGAYRPRGSTGPEDPGSGLDECFEGFCVGVLYFGGGVVSVFFGRC